MRVRLGVASRFICLFLLGLLLPTAGQQPAAQRQLADEVARLRKLAEEVADDGQFWPSLKPGIEAGLHRIAQDLEAGRTLVALRGLSVFRTDLLAYRYLIAHLDLVPGGMKVFEQEWRRVDGELRHVEQAYDAGRWDRQPAAVRALAEASWGTARPLYEASREYGAADGVKSGLFYLGQAQAAAGFAQFCRSLRFAAVNGEFAARSYAIEAGALAENVEDAYQPPLSIERHSDFIGINAWIKRAEELDQGRLYYGSLLAYLEGVRSFTALRATAGTAELETLRQAHHSLATRLNEPGHDNSIAQMFLDLAARELERAQAGEEASVRTAQTLLQGLLPAYLDTLQPAAVQAAQQEKLLTVTLVRWPYT